jgi:hypothetical protein
MTRNPLVTVALGAFGVALVLLLASQSSRVQQYNPSHWPPHPDEIIDVHTANLGSQPTIHPAASVTLLQVPVDQSFVLTGTSAPGGPFPLQVCEDLGGSRTIKLATFSSWPVYGLPTDGPLGIVFRPGSSVVAFNATTVDQVLYNVDLYGYLAR